MISAKEDLAFIALGASMIAVLLTISFVGINPSETFTQGTNATNTSNATSAAGGGDKTFKS